MFKKKNFKKSNILEDLNHNEDYKKENDLSAHEPIIKKKVKQSAANTFSSKSQVDEASKQTQDFHQSLQYKSTSELQTKDNGNAFAENTLDPSAMNEQEINTVREQKNSKDISGNTSTQYYTGQKNYTKYAAKSESDIYNTKQNGTFGPIKASKNVRTTCNIDYNPMLCKDYHDTGFCSFGDACIFIHDRGDYKSGWEMERDWDQEQAAKARRLQIQSKAFEEGRDIDEDEPQEAEGDGLPNECQLCDEPFKDPVVTQCNHYFCEQCIMKYFRENKVCPICDTKLNGNFNLARDIVDKIRKQNAKNKKNVTNVTQSSFITTVINQGSKSGQTQNDSNNKKEDDDDLMKQVAQELKDAEKEDKNKFRNGNCDWQY